MKNILIILAILLIPIASYLFLSKNSVQNNAAYANSGKPTLMVFSSTMCLDCQRVRKEIEKIEPVYNNKIEIIKITATDKQQRTEELIEKYGITLVPTLIFMDKNANMKLKKEGYMSEAEIKENLEQLLNG